MANFGYTQLVTIPFVWIFSGYGLAMLGFEALKPLRIEFYVRHVIPSTYGPKPLRAGFDL